METEYEFIDIIYTNPSMIGENVNNWDKRVIESDSKTNYRSISEKGYSGQTTVKVEGVELNLCQRDRQNKIYFVYIFIVLDLNCIFLE